MASAHQTHTTRLLLEQVEQARTGRIAVGAAQAELAVYLVDGHVVGTRATDDTAALIERLGGTGHLSTMRVRQLQAMVNMSLPILGRQVHDPILGLISDEVGETFFDRLQTERFRENLRRFVGHKGAPRFVDGIAPWCEMILVDHDSVDLVARSVQDWDLASALTDSKPLMAGPVPGTRALEMSAVSALQGGSRSVSDIVAALDLEPLAARAFVMRLIEEGVLTDGRVDSPDDSWPHQAEAASASSMALVSDDELDAFAGMDDDVRGGGGVGTFVSKSHNLDRVEIADYDAILDVTQPGAGESAYSAPTLTEGDALAKIDVANEVLSAIARSVTRTRGGSRGAATIQLLIDGRPRAFTALFDGIKATSAGGLPSREVLANLRRRPPTEQRRLLNQGLLDLLDRALDRAADELPDEVFDHVLEQVMGYRQRLGL